MKKTLSLIAFLFISICIFAQTPQKMSYQAVIRNASNNLVTNAPVKMRISILQGSTTGSSVYSELHSATTNSNGLVTIEIGAGTSPTGTFSSINWGNGTYFLKTETDPNNSTNYSIVGTSQLLSVPYALCAGSTQPLNLMLYSVMDFENNDAVEIWTATIDGNNRKKIPITLPQGFFINDDAKLNPDRKSITFSAYSNSGMNTTTHVYKCNLDGSNLTRLIDGTNSVNKGYTINGVY